jgi:hypothetical protein
MMMEAGTASFERKPADHLHRTDPRTEFRTVQSAPEHMFYSSEYAIDTPETQIGPIPARAGR